MALGALSFGAKTVIHGAISARRHKGSRSVGRPGKKTELPKKPVAGGNAVLGRGVWLVLAALLLATLAAYQPAWHGSMLWDDDRHITRGELQSAEGLWRIWFELGATQQYYPLVHSAFWIQHRLWGDNTLGYHVVSIVLHALSAFLIGVILQRLAVPGAWLAAVIFALHPVHAESVAWITELKNTLSGLLYLGAALAYLHFDEGRQKRLYALTLALFVLGLLSKTVTATLPAALLVVFWWQRGRLSGRRDVVPLMPFFVLGAAGGVLTAWLERTLIGAQGAEFQFTVIERGLIAGRVIWFYLGKLYWPADLIFIYPRWQVSEEIAWQYLYPLGAIVLVAGVWLLRKRSRGPLAAVLFFCGTLFPVLGFFNVYPFRFSFVADHFQYLASIGMIALFAGGVAGLARRWNVQAGPAVMSTLVLGCTLALLTWSQSRQYAGAGTLYRATLSRNPSCWLAHINLGILKLPSDAKEAEAYFKEALRLRPDLAEAYINLGLPKFRGDVEQAQAYFKEAVRLRPDSAEAHNNLGCALQQMGRLEEAVKHFEEALQLNPDYPDAYYNLGNALQKMGRLREAVAKYQEALRLKPDAAEIHSNLGDALRRMGRLNEAAAQYKAALRLRPDYAEAHFNLGYTLQASGLLEEAVAQYSMALRYKPASAEVHNNLGAALERLDRLEEAATHFAEAVRFKPDSHEAHYNLGFALQRLGRLEEAVAQYHEALRLRPEYPDANYRLGNALQRLGRLEEAVAQYRKILARAPGSAEVHNNLGAALEVLGRLGEAVAHYREALRLNPDSDEARDNLDRALGRIRTGHVPDKP